MKGRDPSGNMYMNMNKKMTSQQYFYDKVKKSQTVSTSALPKQSILSDTQDTTVINGPKNDE